MAARRPRIKALANLAPKRNIKGERVSSSTSKEMITETVVTKNESLKIIPCTNSENLIRNKRVKIQEDNFSNITDQIASVNAASMTPERNTENLFKYPPPSMLNKKFDSQTSIEEVLDYAPEDLLKRDKDTQMINQEISSPMKHRQRIRPTPYFGLRRNSIQGSSSDIEDEPRRQRYLSTSSNHSSLVQMQPNKNTLNRIRTESSCSNISDHIVSRDITKPRKGATSEEYQRIAVAKKEFQARYSGKTPEKTQLKMFDLIYYNPVTNPMTNTSNRDKSDNCSVRSINNSSPTPSVHSELPESFPEDSESSLPVPQLKLGPNGEMVLDEKSLIIETTGEKEARMTLANTNIVYLDEYSGSYGFYKRHKRTKDWPPEETIKFYRCLHTIGTDFSLMLQLFPNRTRRDLKLKFKKEEKCNLKLINKALLHPKTFNIEELKTELEKEEHEAAEKLKKWEEMKKAVLSKKTEEQVKSRAKSFGTSRGGRCLTDGDYVYENEHISLPPRQNPITIPKLKNILHAIINETGNDRDKQLNSPFKDISKRMEYADKKDINETEKQLPGILDSESHNETENVIEDGTVEYDEFEYSNENISEHQTTDSDINGIELCDFMLRAAETNELEESEACEEDLEYHSTILEQNDSQDQSELITDISNKENCDNIVQLIVDSTQLTENQVLQALDGCPSENYDNYELNSINVDENLDQSDKRIVEKCTDISENEYPNENCNNSESNITDNIENLDLSLEEKDLEECDNNYEDAKFVWAVENFSTELAQGSLVLVSSEDPDNSSTTIYEIYKVCKETGQLADEPMRIPNELMNCILEVVL